MPPILIKNGRVWNGYCFTESDVLVEEGKVFKIAKDLDIPKGFVFEAAGMTVLPGLVDTHVHFSGPEPDRYGFNAEMSCLPFGVTAAADAGGAHADRYLADNYLVKNVTFIRVPIKDDAPDFTYTERKLALYDGNVIGLKVYFDTEKPGVRSSRPLQKICEYAKEHGFKLMVHCSDAPVPMAEYLPLLSPGDILTHAFHGASHNAQEDDFAALTEAQRRGVVVDTGFAGHVNTGLSLFKKAISKGILPDTISTDITRASAYHRGGRYGLPMCMSMARAAGMEETDIFRAVTSTPAKALGKEGTWGILKEGHTADIAVLEYGSEGFSLTDRFGGSLKSDYGYRCKLTVANGIIVWRD